MYISPGWLSEGGGRMKLFGLALKNVSVKWWRSLTLGFFIFCVTFVMIMSNSFILAAKKKVESVIQKGITGQIQIRSEKSIEGDMVSQYSMGWDALEPIKASNISAINEVLKKDYPEIKMEKLVRQSVFFTNQDKREETMLIGIEPNFQSYKEAFILTEGRYLEPSAKDEIILSDEQAKSFNVKVGDKITIKTKNLYGLDSKIDLKVAGIGNFIMLSQFSYKANYTNSAAVRQLTGMSEGEATDVILFTTGNKSISAIKEKLSEKLKGKGIKNSITKGKQLTSEELKVSDISFEDKNEGVKISDFEEMGETFKGVSGTMFRLVNILITFLIIIVSILIINLVYMTGFERYKEIGTMRAMGFSKPQVIRVFMGEIIFLSTIAALLSVIVSSGLIYMLGSSGIESPIPALDFIMGKTLDLSMDINSIVLNLVIVTGISFATSFYPAYRACSVDPAQAIRTV